MAAATTQQVIVRPAQITKRWLAASLRAAGAIHDAEVVSVAVAHWRAKPLSDLYHIEATYDGPVANDVPRRFALKLSRAHDVSSVANNRRWKEYEFYSRVAPTMADPPVPRAFAAAYDPRQRCSHLLLEDLGVSHGAPSSPFPPSRDQLRGAVECLAWIHAGWWDHPELHGVAPARDEAWIEGRAAAVRRRLARFMVEHGDHVPAPMRAPLDDAAQSWPAILRRTTAFPLTVVHGDAHPWNFLSPLAAGYRTYLLDWEGWSIEPGPHDLASLIALHLPASERRAAHEELIDHYASRLRGHGVTGYSDAACWADYRWAVTRRVMAPVGLWSQGTKPRVWWSALEHITAAYDELRCDELM
jgi:hypothetical protein